MFSLERWARQHLAPMFDPLIALLARTKVSPDLLTALGMVLNVVAGALIALGEPFWGGVVMTLLAMPLDVLDGGVARKRGVRSTFGTFLDSTVDRVAEGAILGGVAVLFAQRQMVVGVALAFAALIGTYLVSYTRARAEGLGLDCTVGVFGRLGRFVVLALGLLAASVFPEALLIMVALLTLFSFYTTGERVVHVYRLTRL